MNTRFYDRPSRTVDVVNVYKDSSTVHSYNPNYTNNNNIYPNNTTYGY